VSPRRLSRRRRRLRLIVLGILIVGLVALGVWLAAGRTVVPELTARLYPIRYSSEIAKMANRYKVDPYLVAAVARAESDFDPKAVSKVGAVGVMQIMPDTAAWITRLESWKGATHPTLTAPADNLELGACYLAFLLGEFDQSVRAAIAAYNAGQGAVSNWLAETAAKQSSSNPTLALSDIPFGETRVFVQKVEHYYDLFRQAHPGVFADRSGTMKDAILEGLV
jgi:soluble lytic murein transglycosylase